MINKTIVKTAGTLIVSAGVSLTLFSGNPAEAAENGQQVQISIVEYPPYGDPLGHEVEYSIV